MRDPLKNYIDQHRAELDVAVPSEELWTNIEKAMIVAIPAAGISSGIPWLKYFAFGLSSVAGAAVVYTLATTSSPASAETKEVPVPMQTVIVNEPVATSTPLQATPDAFIFANAATELPPPVNTPPTTSFSEVVYADTLPPEIISAHAPVPLIAAGDSVFTGIKRVEIISTSASVIVVGTNGNELSVDHKTVEGAELELEYKRNDTLLQVFANVKCDEEKSRRRNKCVSIHNSKIADPEFTVNVPAGVSVVVQNTYGDTKVSNVSGAVCEVHSSSGDVILASVSAVTNVVTSYGDLDARDITGNLTVRLSSGSAVVKQVTGNVDVVSTYGDQALTGITGNLKINGSSGQITVTNLRGDINANTTYGDIQITDFKGAARLVSANGDIVGDKIELTANSTFVTTYGNLTMTLINPLEALSFELATMYGDILVDKNGEQFRNESSLQLTRGNILIKATSSSGDQVFR